jgi:hypothetical protein
MLSSVIILGIYYLKTDIIMTEDKELAFGKVYGKVGSTSVNLIL